MSLSHKDHWAVPPQLQYGAKQNDDGVVGDKSTIYIRPSQPQTVYNPGDSLRFRLGMGKTIDPASLVIYFEVKTAAGWSVEDHVGALFRTCNIRFNDSVLVERIDLMNRLRSVLSVVSMSEGYKRNAGSHEGWLQTPPQYQITGGTASLPGVIRPEIPIYDEDGKFISWVVNNPGGVISTSPNFIDGGGNFLGLGWVLGQDALNQQQAKVLSEAAAATGPVYGLKLDLIGLLNTGLYMHLPVIGSLDIELIAESTPRNVLNCNNKANAIPASFTINNPYLTVDTIDMSTNYLVALDRLINGTGLTMDFDTYQVTQVTLAIPAGTQQIRHQRTYQSLKSLFFWLYVDTGTDAVGVNNRLGCTQNKLGKACKLNLKSYNVLVDGRPMNAHLVTNESEALLELQKALKQHGDATVDSQLNLQNRLRTSRAINNNATAIGATDDHAAILYQSLNSGFCAAVYGVDFEKSSLLSGRRCQEIVMELTFDGPYPTNNVTLFYATHFDKRIQVNAGKAFTEMD